MKITGISLAFLCYMGMFSNAWAQQYSLSHKLKKPVVIDGSADEWTLPLNYYDAKTKVQFSISNDSANLYLCFIMTDPTTESRVLHAGMEIWLDTTGKKKQQFGILFPLTSPGESSSREKGETPSTDNTLTAPHGSDKKSLIKEKIECHLVNFKDAASNTGLKNPNGMELALGIGKLDMLIYEVKIPFNTFYSNMRPADSLKDFGLTIKVNGMSGGSGSAHSGGHSEGGSGAMGGSGMGGGGMGRGGMHGASSQPRGGSSWNDMSEPVIYKTKIHLTFK